MLTLVVGKILIQRVISQTIFNIFMPPTLEKLEGLIVFGFSVVCVGGGLCV